MKHKMLQQMATLLNDALDKGEKVDVKNIHPKIFYHMHNLPGRVKQVGNQEYRVSPTGCWVKIK